MADCMQNLGLGFFKESEEDALNLFRFVAEKGKCIRGYYGYPYINYNWGNVDLVLNTIKSKNGLETVSLETHSAGACVWDVKVIADITPHDKDVVEKRLFVSKSDEDGGAVMDVVNSDVLPSFLYGDELKLQMVAFAQYIDYYANEEEYVNAQPGQTVLGDGAIVSSEFLFNHNPDINEDKKDYERDNIVLIRGTVKMFRDGMLDFGDKQERGYIRCLIDTQFGELELIHTLEQVNKEQYNNLRAGSIVSGAFILSGDAAIYEYENGIIRDEEHHLKLLRYTFEEGKPDRLISVLNENALYRSEVTGKEIHGKHEIIEHIRFVNNNTPHKYFVYMAVIQHTDGDLRFGTGKRCLVLASDREDNIESIVFIEQDDDNNIKEIYLSKDARYHFKLDKDNAQVKTSDTCSNDVFTDCVFSSGKWSAPTLTSPEDIRKRLDGFGLVGRKIVSMKMIGMSYTLRRDDIEDYVYIKLSDLPEDERNFKSDYSNIEPEFEFQRFSEIDEPLLIKFEDGNTFEIDTPMETEFRFSLNCIPWNINAGTNLPNANADILFDICLNKEIVDVKIETSSLYMNSMCADPLDEKNTKRWFVRSIILWLEGDIGLRIEPFMDYCHISCINKQEDIVTIPFKKLKTALFNYEDLHNDK